MATVREAWEMRCPSCKSDEGIRIAATVWVDLLPDGTDADGDHVWDDDSAAYCHECGFTGTVKSFEIKGGNMRMITLEDGRQFKVSFSYDYIEDEDQKLHIKRTTAFVRSESGDAEFSGAATVHPRENANRRIGRKIALQRALLAGFSKEERREIWRKLAANGLRLEARKGGKT